MNLKCKLTTDELIELAETGKVRNIVLDSTAKIVLHECLNMLNFEKNITKERKNGMQDKFKFRAWDSIAKEYIFDSYALYELFVNDIDNSYQVEQCTGLKDKNGKLIYEGDIVEVPVLYNGIPTGKKQCCKVYYKHGAFNIYAVKSKYLKVIGNIHENPELLEDNK